MLQIGLFLQIYANPLKAFSRIIDEGRLLFAIAVALVAVFALQVPRQAEFSREIAQEQAKLLAHLNAARQAAGQRAPIDDDAMENIASQFPVRPTEPPLFAALENWSAHGSTCFAPALGIAIGFVPIAILILTYWDGLGGFGTILFRDYLTLLVCVLMAWGAAYLPLAMVNGAQSYGGLPGYGQPVLWAIAQAYFLVLATCAVRTVLGASFGHAAGATVGAWAGGVAAVGLQSTLGGAFSWLASPFILYLLWSRLNPDFQSLTTGLSSRQRLKRHLEIATLNPNDADAHYQLGLIYQQRRQYPAAIERFQKAVAIDPKEPDAHYQLGRIAREQGRHEEAFERYRTVARLNDKHSANEVWREMGVVCLSLGRAADAAESLEFYLERRSYDPEGLCWYGRALTKLDRRDEAANAFRQAIEAVRTMPPARKRQVRFWGGEAAKDLHALEKKS